MNIMCSEIAKAAGLKLDRTIGHQIIFFCPYHGDEHASLTINPKKNVWMCAPCGKSGGAWAFAFFVSGFDKTHKVINWLVDRGIMEERKRQRGKFVKSWIYKDPDGNEILQSRKFIDRDGKKSFAIYHKDGKEWKPGVNGVKLYPYRIDQWKDKPVVWVAEGEKCCDTLWQLGIPATTNPLGAMSWKEEYNKWFKDKKVVILPDSDDAGRKHASIILAGIVSIAVGVKVVTLPNLPPKGDVCDYLTTCGGTREELIKIVRATPWSTFADADVCGDLSEEAKILVRRANYEIGELFERADVDFEERWNWIKENDDLWRRIRTAEQELDKSCASKDSLSIIKARCIEYKSAFKDAIGRFLEEVIKKERKL